MLNSKKRILVVDDDRGIANLHASRLSRYGHEAVCAFSSRDALDTLDKLDRVDLLLLDYSLSNDMSGLALLLIIRERGITAPAILVTGLEDPNVILQALRAGVRDFIPKSLDYLDQLPITVEKVLRQSDVEQQAAASMIILEKQELLEAAFDAGRLCAFVWDLPSGSFKCTGHFADLFGAMRENQITDFESLLSFMNPSDQAVFRRAFEYARDSKVVLEHQFRIHRDDGEIRWVWAVGRFKYDHNGLAVRVTCVLNDISKRKVAELEVLQSNEKTRALNDRLQQGMVETNHRVKNHLQKLISLLNVQARSTQGVLDAEGVKTVVSHIQSLAALHDVLAAEASSDESDGLSVDAAEVLAKVLAGLGRVLEDRLADVILDPCRVSPRQASSLAVVVNELIAISLKQSNGQIAIEMKALGDTAVLRVDNRGAQFPDSFDPEHSRWPGLELVRMLCRGDFGSQPTFTNMGRGSRVEVLFPLVGLH